MPIATGLMSFGVMLFPLPILIGQWVGILGLGKTERNPAWWCMFAGTCCTSLGTVGSALFLGLMMFGQSSPGSSMSSETLTMVASGGLSGLGSLLFAIGFAIHGQQASHLRKRISELEVIAAAQGEELHRQRPSY